MKQRSSLVRRRSVSGVTLGTVKVKGFGDTVILRCCGINTCSLHVYKIRRLLVGFFCVELSSVGFRPVFFLWVSFSWAFGLCYFVWLWASAFTKTKTRWQKKEKKDMTTNEIEKKPSE